MIILARLYKIIGINKNGKTTRFLRDEVDTLSNPFIPFEGGGLRRLKTYPNNYSIKYTSLDAHYHYNGVLYVSKSGSSWAKKGEKKYKTNKKMRYHTSGTGSKWDKLMMQRRRNDVVRDVQSFIRKGGK